MNETSLYEKKNSFISLMDSLSFRSCFYSDPFIENYKNE